MFGLTFEKILLIGIIAVFLLGPEKLPHYAAQLARLVRSLRDMANGAKDRMRDEMGPEFDELDWKKLDPRQYDPRRIIREALIDDDPFDIKPATVSRVTPEAAVGAVGGVGAVGAAGDAGAAGSAGVAGVAGVGTAAGAAAVVGAVASRGGDGALPAAQAAPFDSEAT